MVIGLILTVAAYLTGSIASAVVVCRLMGLPDPRSQGSGNPGATNVLRIGGKKAAAITLAGDVLKGLLPVLLARAVTDSAPILAGAALAAFVGHLFPIFFGFQGGKGVATAFGALTGLAWQVAPAILGVWLAMAFAFRYSSLSALTAAALAPLFTAFFQGNTAFVVGVSAISLLLIWRHRENIGRLLAGTESKIGAKSNTAA